MAMTPHGGAALWLPSPIKDSRWVGPVAFALVTAAYLAFAQLVLWLNDPVSAGAGLWPAAGVTLAALLLLPSRSWGWVVAAVVLAEMGGDLARGYGVPASIGWTVGNVVEPLAGAWLIRRLGTVEDAVKPVRALMLFLACGVIAGPLIGATVGATTSVLSYGGALPEVWLKYFVGDALGVLVVTPAVLALRARRSEQSTREAAALGGLTLAVSVSMFGGWGGAWLTMPYLLMPCLTWAALRFGVRGVSWLALAIAVIASVGTAYGDGPFARSALATDAPITMLQVFLAISVSCSLLLAALVDHVTESQRIEADWRHQATHDPLTGLANRSLLDVVVGGSLTESNGHNPLRLVMCDLDNFKIVNDTWGHAAGDALLRIIAKRIEHSVRSHDVVARISGDEFVLMLKDTDEGVAAGVTHRVMAAVVQPVRLPDAGVVVPSVSMGMAAHVHGESVDQLMARADESMYRAKARGGGRVEHA